MTDLASDARRNLDWHLVCFGKVEHSKLFGWLCLSDRGRRTAPG